jgi:hypothetical protein
MQRQETKAVISRFTLRVDRGLDANPGWLVVQDDIVFRVGDTCAIYSAQDRRAVPGVSAIALLRLGKP